MSAPETMTVNGREWVSGRYTLEDIDRASRAAYATYKEAFSEWHDAASLPEFRGVPYSKLLKVVDDPEAPSTPGLKRARSARAAVDRAQARHTNFELAKPALHAMFYRSTFPRFVFEGLDSNSRTR